jgi:hypothetical protein
MHASESPLSRARERGTGVRAHSALQRPKTEVLGVRYSALSTQYSVLSTQHSALSTQYSALNTHRQAGAIALRAKTHSP